MTGCICQDQHRRGYCTEPGCPYAIPKVERWIDPDIMRIESECELTEAQVRAMLDRQVLRHVKIDHAAAVLLAMRPEMTDVHVYRDAIDSDCVIGTCSMNNCLYPDCVRDSEK